MNGDMGEVEDFSKVWFAFFDGGNEIISSILVII